jgi:hypothetical protein
MLEMRSANHLVDCLSSGGESHAIQPLSLQAVPLPLRRRIFVAVAFATHRCPHPVGLECVLERITATLLLAAGGDCETPLATRSDSVHSHERSHAVLANLDASGQQLLSRSRPAVLLFGLSVDGLSFPQQ